MSESKSVIGLNMLALWDDRGTLAPWSAWRPPEAANQPEESQHTSP
jgi:hypothetical protein